MSNDGLPHEWATTIPARQPSWLERTAERLWCWLCNGGR